MLWTRQKYFHITLTFPQPSEMCCPYMIILKALYRQNPIVEVESVKKFWLNTENNTNYYGLYKEYQSPVQKIDTLFVFD